MVLRRLSDTLRLVCIRSVSTEMVTHHHISQIICIRLRLITYGVFWSRLSTVMHFKRNDCTPPCGRPNICPLSLSTWCDVWMFLHISIFINHFVVILPVSVFPRTSWIAVNVVESTSQWVPMNTVRVYILLLHIALELCYKRVQCSFHWFSRLTCVLRWSARMVAPKLGPWATTRRWKGPVSSIL